MMRKHPGFAPGSPAGPDIFVSLDVFWDVFMGSVETSFPICISIVLGQGTVAGLAVGNWISWLNNKKTITPAYQYDYILFVNI